MNLKHFLLPVIVVCLGGSLQAQTPDTSPSASPPPDFEEHEGGWDHHHGGWHHHHGGWLFKKLNLTDAQRQQLKNLRASIRASNQAAFRSALLNYLQAKADLENAISQNSPDLSSLATSVANAQSQLILLRAQRQQQFQTQVIKNNVLNLTPDQLQTLTEFQQKKAARLQDRINELKNQTGS